MQNKRHLAELRATRVEKEQLLQRVHDLETQLKASEGEVEDITMEVELLKSKLKEAQSTTGSVAAYGILGASPCLSFLNCKKAGGGLYRTHLTAACLTNMLYGHYLLHGFLSCFLLL